MKENSPFELLFIESNSENSDDWIRKLHDAGIAFHKTLIREEQQFDQILQSFNFDFVLIDNDLIWLDCKFIIEKIRRANRETPIIVISGHIGEETAVELIRTGANDLLLKESLNRLPSLFRREIDRYRVRIAELKAIEEARQIETQYSNFVSSTLEVIPDGVVVMSEDFEPLMVNYGFNQISKNYADQFECTADELQNEILSTIAKAIQNGVRSEIRIKKRKQESLNSQMGSQD